MKTKTFFMNALILAIGLSFANCNGNKLRIPDTISFDGDYKKAVKEGEFETAHGILESIHDEFVEALGKALAEGQWGYDKPGVANFKVVSKKYFAAIDYIYSHEITSILTNGDDQAADKIVFLLSEIPLDGKCEEGESCPDESPWPNDQSKIAYKNVCIEINKLCDKALTLAINRKNKEFAQNIIELYKPDFNGSDSYKTRDAAKQKLEEAIKDGRFN